MSYNQYMKHWKNHRKDRFTQQCAPSVSSGSLGGIPEFEVYDENGEIYTCSAFSIDDAIKRTQFEFPSIRFISAKMLEV